MLAATAQVGASIEFFCSHDDLQVSPSCMGDQSTYLKTLSWPPDNLSLAKPQTADKSISNEAEKTIKPLQQAAVPSGWNRTEAQLAVPFLSVSCFRF
jgi:hypothetical protein